MQKNIGPVVSRKLRQADWNISPSARKNRHEGIFVSARGDEISVLVDLGVLEHNIKAATGIEATVNQWPAADDVRWTQADADERCYVRFTYDREV